MMRLNILLRRLLLITQIIENQRIEIVKRENAIIEQVLADHGITEFDEMQERATVEQFPNKTVLFIDGEIKAIFHKPKWEQDGLKMTMTQQYQLCYEKEKEAIRDNEQD